MRKQSVALLCLIFCLLLVFTACGEADGQNSAATGKSSILQAVPVSGQGQTVAGVYSPNANYEYLVGSTAWQASAESRALIQQAYGGAKGAVAAMVVKALDPQETDWSYNQNEAGEKVMTYQGQPVALISDIDETLVTSVSYNANIIGANGDYNNVAFNRYVLSDGCEALPGAVDLMNYCRDSGIEVYYVTNRYDQGYKIGQSDSEGGYPKNGGGLYVDKNGNEIGTTIYQVFGKSAYDISLESMTKLGFPVDDQHLILNDQKLNGASKEPARAAIANGTKNYPNGQRADGNSTGSATSIACEPHYVALLLGDQLNDFSDDFSAGDAVERAALTEEYAEYWGVKWFVLPNALYGDALNKATDYGIKELFEVYDYTRR